MKIKSYDDILIVECNRQKYSKRFKHIKGKWIDINGKNQFAVAKEFEKDFQKVVDEINSEEKQINKYNNNISLKVKEEYYKSFNCKPENFGFGELELSKDDGDRSIGSLSSSSYGSSSSDGFPSPETPGKEKDDDDDDDDEEDEEDEEDDLEYVMDKLSELEKRIEKLERKK